MKMKLTILSMLLFVAVAMSGSAFALEQNETDWNVWDNPESDHGAVITKAEIDEASDCWLNDSITTVQLQMLIAAYLDGPHGPWNPWTTPESDGGIEITKYEMKKAEKCWILSRPAPITGAEITTFRLQQIISLYLTGPYYKG